MSEIIVKPELRPCYVDGKKALFHKWVTDGTLDTLALVEYENGRVAKVDTRYFKFADHGAFREVAWEYGKVES